MPAQAALPHARPRRGPRPLILLIRRLAGPPPTPATPGAFLFGLRLLAIAGTTLDRPATPGTARIVGRPRTGHGTGAGAFPQRRLLWLVEAGTHVLCDTVLRPACRGDAPAARQLLRSVEPGMRVLWDRGRQSYELIRAPRERGAHVRGRVGTASGRTPAQPRGRFLPGRRLSHAAGPPPAAAGHPGPGA